MRSESDQRPVFLLSASWRCGSTLLQRMLSQSCLMWGEPYGRGRLLDSLADLFRRITEQWPEEEFFFREQGENTRMHSMIANLYPPPQSLLEAHLQFAETLFAKPAREAGYPQWGIKTVRLTADHGFYLRWLYPKAKLLFLVRHPLDAYRSYFARRQQGFRWFDRWPDRPIDAETFGRHWHTAAESFLEQAEALDARLVRYEDLVSGTYDRRGLADYLGHRLAEEALLTNPDGPTGELEIPAADRDVLLAQVRDSAAALGYDLAASTRNASDSREPKPMLSSAERERLQKVFRSGMTLHQQGKLDGARKCYEEVLAADPDHAGAHHLRGVLYHQTKDRHAALVHLERALALCDHKAVYWNNYGAVLKEERRYVDALKAFRRALQILPTYADALSNVGSTFSALSRYGEAVAALESALESTPGHVDATFNLANCHFERGEAETALSLYRRAFSLSPRRIDILTNLARTLQVLERTDEAIEFFTKLLQLDPDQQAARLQLAQLHESSGAIAPAREHLREASRRGPENGLLALRRADLSPIVFPDGDSIERYRRDYEAVLDRLRSEERFDGFDWREAPRHGFPPSFQLSHHGYDTRPIKERFARLFARHFPHRKPPWRGGERLRVGFLVTPGKESGFVRDTGLLIERLDAERFEPVVLCPEGSEAKCRRAIAGERIRWWTYPHRFQGAVEAIAEAKCDVIYHRQIGTDAMNYFLPFVYAAPVQCTGWATHGTSGIPAVDDYLGSTLVEPEDADAHYTEQLYRFSTFPTCQRRMRPPEPAERADFGLPESGALYFCPQRLAKFHPDFDPLLRGVLEQDPRGHLIVLRGRFPKVVDQLRARWERTLGAALLRRVIFLPSQKPRAYHQLLSLATLVLDAPHYSASLTGWDAFSLGVPIVTLPGRRKVERYALGLYRRMGIADPVTDSPESYVHTAVRLGTEADAREELAARIAERSDLLFDDPRAVADFENYLEAVSKRQESSTTEPIES